MIQHFLSQNHLILFNMNVYMYPIQHGSWQHGHSCCKWYIYFTGITTCIYTELAPKVTATASVGQSVERWSRDPGSRVRFPAGGLGHRIEIDQKSDSVSAPLKLMFSRMSPRASHRRHQYAILASSPGSFYSRLFSYIGPYKYKTSAKRQSS